LGIPEKVIYGSYALFIPYFLIRFYKFILETSFFLLGIAFFFFAFSVISDLLEPQFIDHYLVEDGAKFIGIICWLIYFSETAKVSLQKNFRLSKKQKVIQFNLSLTKE
jgi:hypothetical protein